MRKFALALVTGVGIGAGAMVTAHLLPRDIVPMAVAQGAPAAVVDAEEQTVIRVARQASPAVVSVSRAGGSGSGVLIRRDGVILTNAHVVGGVRTVLVGLADGRRLQGRVMGRDPTLDIAVVDIDITDAPVAPLGDSDRLEVGQRAIAIGNPLGLDRTVTTGVVSAINRSPRGIPVGGLIQTDAAISPGNSGGPLLDSHGQVIGINTVILQGSGVSGLGFAVPINLARDAAEQVLATGTVRRAFLGINYGDVDPEIAAQFGLPVREGIVVLEVVGGSPAARAGLARGDIIIALDAEDVRRGGDLQRLMRARRPGDTVTLTVVAPNGRRSRVAVRLATLEE